MPQLSRLTVRGYKSIRALEDFELRNLNVLIGANGAGKSNLISLFRMLAELAQEHLRLFVPLQDGPDALLHGSRQRTGQIDVDLDFGLNGYRVSLKPAGERLLFAREETWSRGDLGDAVRSLGTGHEESRLPSAHDDAVSPYVRRTMAGWRVYHFHDTSTSAPVRQAQATRDNLRLKPDAGNLAPFLRRLRETETAHYERIVGAVRLVAPFFGDFVYREATPERIGLEWVEADAPDTVYGPRQLSDGTLRFICLATLLLQPTRLQPDLILIDEPELGLHPYALAVLASLLRQASETRQLLVSTQSVELVSEMEPEDLVVVSRSGDGSTFNRLEPEHLEDWLEEYAMGELWKMNVLGGRPTR
jgi:predicted ATPase